MTSLNYVSTGLSSGDFLYNKKYNLINNDAT